MKYAIIEFQSHQYKVTEGQELVVDRLSLKEGEAVIFDQVLLTSDGKKVAVGKPTVKGAVVKGKISEHFRGEKIRVATYKAKSRYRRVIGHRSDLTKVQILSV